MAYSKVSVVIPAYNHERFIGPALESVLGQTHQDFEIVVAVNGSTDRTAEIVEERTRRDDRIRLVRQANQGQAAAANSGVAQARAELVAVELRAVAGSAEDGAGRWHERGSRARVVRGRKSCM